MKYKVFVENTGASFDCDEDLPVLEAMFRSGKGPIRHGCCGGGCGVCRAKIVSGRYFEFKKMSAAHVKEQDKNDGLVLLCCVKPRSNLLIAVW